MGPKRILVTGGAGFIGAACAREFLRRGFSVTAMVHRRAAGELPGAAVVQGDLADRSALASLLEEAGPFDAVVHCAGLASDVARRRRLMAANYHAVRNLVECMLRQPLGRLVHVSTTDVYGIRDFVDADEDTPLEDNLHNSYPRSKILAEECIRATLPAERYVILRPGVVCGAGDQTILPRVLAFLRRSPRVVYFGRWRGRNRWPLTDVGNVARAAVLAATRNEALGQAYNVMDPPTVTVEQYYRWVLRAYLPERAEMKSLTIPLPLAWPFAAVSSLLSRALNLKRPLLEPSLYALHSIAANLDLSSRKLQKLFALCGEQFESPGIARADCNAPWPSPHRGEGL